MERPKDDGWRIDPNVPETLMTMLPRSAKVVELGGGIGSPYLHHLFPNTITIEHSQKWASYLIEMGLRMMHLPLVAGWYEETPELLYHLASADCIIVDGPPGELRPKVRRRLGSFAHDAVVVFDDSHRHQIHELLEHLVEDGGWERLGSLRDGKRETSILRTPSRDDLAHI